MNAATPDGTTSHVHIRRHGRPCVTRLIRNEAGRRGGLVEDRRRGRPQRLARDQRGHGVWPTPGRLASSPASPTSA